MNAVVSLEAPLAARRREADLVARATEALVSSASAIAEALAADAEEAEASGFPSRSIDRLAVSGLLAAPLPVDGTGARLVDRAHRLALLRVLAHIGRGSLPVGRLYEGHVNALALVAAFGTPSQKAAAAAAAADGALFGVWNTEPPGEGLRLRADRRGAFTLVGKKAFASGAGHVAWAIATARDADGAPQMALIDLRAADPAIDGDSWNPHGMKPTASHTVDFTGVVLEPDALLGAPGDYLREPAFSGGAVRFCAVQIGGIEAVFDATRRFLRETRRTEDTLQRLRLGEMAMRTAGVALWLEGAARHAEGLVDEAASIAFAHLMRAAVEDAALAVMQLAERSVGARGLLGGQPFGRLLRDLSHYLRQAGPDAAAVASGAYVLAREAPAPALWRPASS